MKKNEELSRKGEELAVVINLKQELCGQLEEVTKERDELLSVLQNTAKEKDKLIERISSVEIEKQTEISKTNALLQSKNQAVESLMKDKGDLEAKLKKYVGSNPGGVIF